MHQVRRWCADAALLVFFLWVERSPFGTAVDLVFIDDQSAFLAHSFAALLVSDERTATLGTRGVRSFGLGFSLRFRGGCSGLFIVGSNTGIWHGCLTSGWKWIEGGSYRTEITRRNPEANS